MTRVLIKHSTGSKANRIEQFSIDSCEDISLGRDSAATVTYDPDRDDLVSRRHALIRSNKDGDLSFTIEDLQSRNGTFVNGERLAGKRELLPGDVVELGAGGPTFTFDVEPRPPHLLARTKMMRGGEEPAAAAPEAAAGGGTGGGSGPAPYKVGVGRSTVVDMLSEQLKRVNRTWIYVLAGVLALIVLMGAGLYYQNVVATKQVTATLAETSAKLGDTSGRMAPKQIAAAYRGATALINVEWRLIDRQSGKQVFQRYCTPRDGKSPQEAKALPAYVRLKEDSAARLGIREANRIVPWLTTDEQGQQTFCEGQSVQPIRQGLKGSGFVVRSDGFILTNKHVATPWKYPFYLACEFQPDFMLAACERGPSIGGVLFEEGGSPQGGQVYKADDWWPERQAVLIEEKTATPISREFQPRIEVLEVRLPGNSLALNARTIREASNADVALIKIDPPDPDEPCRAGPSRFQAGAGRAYHRHWLSRDLDENPRSRTADRGNRAVLDVLQSGNPGTDDSRRHNLEHQRRSRAEGAERHYDQLRGGGLSAYGQCDRSGKQRRTGIRQQRQGNRHLRVRETRKRRRSRVLRDTDQVRLGHPQVESHC